MPYHIEKVRGGYFVEDKKGKRFSAKPLTKKRAKAQQVAIAISESKRTEEPVSKFFG